MKEIKTQLFLVLKDRLIDVGCLARRLAANIGIKMHWALQPIISNV